MFRQQGMKHTFLLICCIGLVGSATANETERISERQFTIPGSDAQVKLWDTMDQDGQRHHWYEISENGKTIKRQTSYLIKMNHGDFDPLVEVPPPLWEHLGDASNLNLYLVQFHTQALEPYRKAIRELGGEIYKYVNNHAYVVKMEAPVRAALEDLSFVRWMGPMLPAYRLEDYLLQHAGRANEYYPFQKYNISVYRYQDQKAVVSDRLRAMGAQVDNDDAGKRLLVATLTPDQLFELATWDEVMFVDRWGALENDMDLARELGGADFLETMEGWTGQGVRGEVLDSGFNLTHTDFQSRPLIEHTSVFVASHGASTSGIVFGDGTTDPTARGMLPDGQGIVAQGLLSNRYQHTSELPADPYNAVFQTSSVGSPRTLSYTNISMETDEALFDFDVAHCQSQSNAGDQMSRPEAWAKNIISGGGFLHRNTVDPSDDCWCNTASIGPASDGRIKPTVSSFYDNIRTVTSGSPTAYTSFFGGTSGATPIICGHLGLVFQMWGEGIFGNEVDPDGTVFSNRPHMTTAKALLINSAIQYAFTGTAHDMTRVHQGWGRPDVANLYNHRDVMFVIDEATVIGNTETATYEVQVGPGEDELKVTMTYADPAGTPFASQHRINDLSLRVTTPDGLTQYWGNNGLLEGNYSTPGGVANVIDTVENVFVENPAEGVWTVEVIATEINEDGHAETPELDADFALVISGAVEAVAPVCPGDLNGDNLVTVEDMGILRTLWGEAGPLGDLDEDGAVTILDVLQMDDLVGNSCL